MYIVAGTRDCALADESHEPGGADLVDFLSSRDLPCWDWQPSSYSGVLTSWFVTGDWA